MSVDGLQFLDSDRGTVAGQRFLFAASDPSPGFPLTQVLGPFTVSVAVDAIVILWQATNSPLTRFDYLKVVAGEPPSIDALDGDGTTPALAGQLELTCNNGDAAEQQAIVQLRTFLPFRLHSDVSRYGLTAGGNGFAGTADVWDLVRYKNTTAAAIVVTFAMGAA